MSGIRIDQDVALAVDEAALLALAADLPRYVEIEPHLVSARWLTPVPIRAGSVAEVTVEIPFAVAAVRHAVGAPRGLVTVSRWNPPDELAAEFDGQTVAVRVTVQLAVRDEPRTVRVRGVIVPRSRWAGAALRPLRPLLERLAARSIERGLRRIEAALEDPAAKPRSV